jgi:hypothetical protein
MRSPNQNSPYPILERFSEADWAQNRGLGPFGWFWGVWTIRALGGYETGNLGAGGKLLAAGSIKAPRRPGRALRRRVWRVLVTNVEASG